MRPLLVLAAALAAGQTWALPTQFDSNGHYYEVVRTDTLVGWNAARAIAAGMTFDGMDGYLATLTDAAENAFVSDLLAGDLGWIGGSDAQAEGTWIWVDGPEAGMQFWDGAEDGTPIGFARFTAGEEPNNCCGGESYLVQNWALAPDAALGRTTGTWNDLAPFGEDTYDDGERAVRAFVVEYGGTAPVPEPTTGALLMLGLGGLAWRTMGSRPARRRRMG